MEPIILQAQTGTMAALEIIAMLVVAAIIGYLTSFFYYRSVYTRKIDKLLKEMENLNASIVRLTANKNDLERKLQVLNEDFENFKEKSRRKPQKNS